jgi:hypothetical protein
MKLTLPFLMILKDNNMICFENHDEQHDETLLEVDFEVNDE